MAKILVLYFSRADENYYPNGIHAVAEGNTAKLAQAIAQVSGADLFAVQTDHHYPKAYHACTEEAKKLLAQGYRPHLTTDCDVSPYDVICVGYPMWWGTMPTDLMAFLEQHAADFAGKKVLPFCTHEGSHFDRSLKDLQHLLPGAQILDGLEMYGHVAQDARLLKGQAAQGAVMAAQLSVAAAAELNDGLVLLPGGTVTIGSPDSERQRQTDETQHQVTLSAFYVDPHEVTQQDYQAVMGTNPSHFKGDNLPVEQVTWYDAINYCNKLSKAKGLTPVYQIDGTTVTWNRAADGYRLLTEAEWEYSARAGTQSVFYEGGQIVADQVNFCGSYPYLIEENYLSHQNPEVVTSTYRQETMPVDGLAPNSWGLYHMEGNVSEWCFDYYAPYDTAQNTDPSGPTSGSLRVNRGGGWNDFAKHVRTAYRSVTTPDTVEQNLGFRIARNAEPGSGNMVTTYSLDIKTPEQPKVLVAYFSYTGNTEQGAQLMAEALGADLFTIEMEQPYRGNI